MIETIESLSEWIEKNGEPALEFTIRFKKDFTKEQKDEIVEAMCQASREILNRIDPR